MCCDYLEQLPDSLIPAVRAPNPILDPRAEKRLAQGKKLFLPGIPLPVANRAQEAATATGVTLLLLVGLTLKLTGKATVRLKPSVIESAGLSAYQVRRALKELEAAGLVRAKTTRGKRREITLIDEEYLAWLRDPKHRNP